jgi:carbonic anhydrase/acetyltransferase-like protein (isoleucine patch superfamily)
MKIHESVFIAPAACVMGRVSIGQDSSVWYGAVIRADVEEVVIGERSNIQDTAVIHADFGEPTIIHNDVTVGHGAIVHGAEVGECSLVGMRATILNRAKIGKYCIIGANALVTEGTIIPDYSLVVGSPAKVIRTLSETQAQMLKMSALHYVENAKAHASGKYPLFENK